MGIAKSQQASQTIRFRRAAFQLSIANLESAYLGAKLIVFLAQMPQSYIVIPETPGSIHRPCRASPQRGYALNGPHADEPHLLPAPDLQREQQDLRRYSGGEESQRTMARWYGQRNPLSASSKDC
jgi:hypothetical protein